VCWHPGRHYAELWLRMPDQPEQRCNCSKKRPGRWTCLLGQRPQRRRRQEQSRPHQIRRVQRVGNADGEDLRCLPLWCLRCGKPMKIIAFILDPQVIERILSHIGEPVEPPRILPARGPPQAEMDFVQDTAQDPWPEMDQTAGQADDCWQ